MLISNMAVLLAERGLTITRVASETGISRTTLTSLLHNQAQGLQFDTLNTLCLYLRVNPADILAFYPVDFLIENVWSERDSNSSTEQDSCNFRGGFTIRVIDGTRINISRINVDSIVSEYLDSITGTTDYVDKCCLSFDDNTSGGNSALIKYLRKLPTPFLSILKKRIGSAIVESMPFSTDIVFDIDRTIDDLLMEN